jgi:phage-related tail fiber protein
MDFIQTSNKQVDKFGTGKHGFSPGNSGTGVLATFLSNAWCDDLQQEVISVVEGAGLVPTAGVRNQMYQAIQTLIANAVAANASGDYKASVRAATTANIASLAGGAPNVLDGVTLVANDRILGKDQTTGSQNGIYVVTTLGTGVNGTWTRATDADGAGELTSGAIVAVEEGTANADSQWMLTTDGAITIGTTALTFVRVASNSIGYLLIQDQKASGTAGGSASAGTQQRALNTTVRNTIAGASLASNQVTLPAGTYRVNGFSVSASSSYHKAWLRNVTDTTVVAQGESCNIYGAAIYGSSSSKFNGSFTITSSKVFDIQHYFTVAQAANGLGPAASSGQVEVYSTLEIIKES